MMKAIMINIGKQALSLFEIAAISDAMERGRERKEKTHE